MFKYLLAAALFFSSIASEEILSQSFQTGKIAINLSNYGRVRVIKDSLSGVRQVDRSSFLAGINPNYVFSYWLSTGIEDSSKTITNPALSDFELYCAVNNTEDNTGQSPDFIVKHNVYGWNQGGYVLVKFTVKNRESVNHDTKLGMEIIPQVDGSYGLETIRYLYDSQIISLYRLPTSAYTGYKLLSSNLVSLISFDWYSGYNNVNPDLFGWLTYSEIDSMFDAGGDGAVSIFSQDELNIAANDSVTMWVGISVGNNQSEMIANMNLAQQKYNQITSVEQTNNLIPEQYNLEQNYPNPFNPETSIRFSIPKREFVSLKIFNSLGQEIASILNRELETGSYNVKFDARGLTSGVYFYSIQAGNFVQTKKMTLLR